MHCMENERANCRVASICHQGRGQEFLAKVPPALVVAPLHFQPVCGKHSSMTEQPAVPPVASLEFSLRCHGLRMRLVVQDSGAVRLIVVGRPACHSQIETRRGAQSGDLFDEFLGHPLVGERLYHKRGEGQVTECGREAPSGGLHVAAAGGRSTLLVSNFGRSGTFAGSKLCSAAAGTSAGLSRSSNRWRKSKHRSVTCLYTSRCAVVGVRPLSGALPTPTSSVLRVAHTAVTKTPTTCRYAQRKNQKSAAQNTSKTVGLHPAPGRPNSNGWTLNHSVTR